MLTKIAYWDRVQVAIEGTHRLEFPLNYKSKLALQKGHFYTFTPKLHWGPGRESFTVYWKSNDKQIICWHEGFLVYILPIT